jgi:glutaredoxin
MITVYTQPGCAACRYTKKFLAVKGIPYTEIDVSINDEARHELVRQGFTGLEMPVVVTAHGRWHGYNREKLKDFAAVYEGEHHA